MDEESTLYQQLAQELKIPYNPDEPTMEPTLHRELKIDTGKIPDHFVQEGLISASDGSHFIILEKFIGTDHTTMYQGWLYHEADLSDQPKKVIVKWVTGERSHKIDFEIANWQKLQQHGCKTPEIYHGFKLYGETILVMEFLDTISANDLFTDIGRQIIPQLQCLHQFACHSDVKPENIMKRGNSYFLIDLGSISYQPKSYGYLRYAFTKIYSSQVPYAGQITTPKHDLLELGFTLTRHALGKEIDPRLSYLSPEIDERIRNYMEYLLDLPETAITSEVYQNLIAKIKSAFN